MFLQQVVFYFELFICEIKYKTQYIFKWTRCSPKIWAYSNYIFIIYYSFKKLNSYEEYLLFKFIEYHRSKET